MTFGADHPQHAEAVEAGQPQVEDDEVETAAADELDGHMSVIGDLGGEAFGGEPLGDERRDAVLVLDDENACQRLSPSCAVPRQGESEQGALAGSGPHAHITVMGAGDAVDDRQTQPRALATATARRRRGEAVEDALLVRGGDAGPGVTDPQVHTVLVEAASEGDGVLGRRVVDGVRGQFGAAPA